MEGGGLSLEYQSVKYMYFYVDNWLDAPNSVAHLHISHVTIDALLMGNKYTVSMCE